MGTSLALPEHTLKKQMMRTTRRTARQIPPTMGMINVQKKNIVTKATRYVTSSILSAWREWKAAYFDFDAASSEMIIPAIPRI